jgi:hypothetical protein
VRATHPHAPDPPPPKNRGAGRLPVRRSAPPRPPFVSLTPSRSGYRPHAPIEPRRSLICWPRERASPANSTTTCPVRGVGGRSEKGAESRRSDPEAGRGQQLGAPVSERLLRRAETARSASAIGVPRRRSVIGGDTKRTFERPLRVMCGRLSGGKGVSDALRMLVGSVMCSACQRGASRPLAMMPSVEDGSRSEARARGALTQVGFPASRCRPAVCITSCPPPPSSSGRSLISKRPPAPGTARRWS